MSQTEKKAENQTNKQNLYTNQLLKIHITYILYQCIIYQYNCPIYNFYLLLKSICIVRCILFDIVNFPVIQLFDLLFSYFPNSYNATEETPEIEPIFTRLEQMSMKRPIRVNSLNSFIVTGISSVIFFLTGRQLVAFKCNVRAWYAHKEIFNFIVRNLDNRFLYIPYFFK